MLCVLTLFILNPSFHSHIVVHLTYFSDLLQITELTQFLIEHCEILGENILQLMDIDEGTFAHPLSLCYDCMIGEPEVGLSKKGS